MKVSGAFRVVSALSFFTSASSVASSSNATSASTDSALLANSDVELGIASQAYDKAKTFISGLSNAQKISNITGGSVTDDNATWTALITKNGAAGINMDFDVSGFTMPNALVMTWNRELYQAQYKATSDEFYAAGYNLIYGPVSSLLGRVVYGGRLPEGFSPDPYLNGIAMEDSIAALNSAGVNAVGRHFLFNEQETSRSSTDRYSQSGK